MSDILVDREKTHGQFQVTAYVSQYLKRFLFNSQYKYSKVQLSDVHSESIDMIAVKLARIISGDPNTKDHWEDIIGYARLALAACEKPEPQPAKADTLLERAIRNETQQIGRRV